MDNHVISLVTHASQGQPVSLVVIAFCVALVGFAVGFGTIASLK